MNWIECNSCEEEFRVISDQGPEINFCPFCGENIEVEVDDEEDDED